MAAGRRPFPQNGRGSPGNSDPMTQRPPADKSDYLAMALQVAWHFVQASAHFLQHGMSPHFRHSAAQFAQAFAHRPHSSPDSGASYSIKATHARHVSKQVRQCFSQFGQSQLTRHSRHARRQSLQALMQFSLSTGSSFGSAPTADEETDRADTSSAKHDTTEKTNRNISSPHDVKSAERERLFRHRERITQVLSRYATARSPSDHEDSIPPHTKENARGAVRWRTARVMNGYRCRTREDTANAVHGRMIGHDQRRLCITQPKIVEILRRRPQLLRLQHASAWTARRTPADACAGCPGGVRLRGTTGRRLSGLVFAAACDLRACPWTTLTASPALTAVAGSRGQHGGECKQHHQGESHPTSKA